MVLACRFAVVLFLIDVTACGVLGILNGARFAVGDDAIGFGGAFHAGNPRLLGLQLRILMSRQLARPAALFDPLRFAGLALIDPVSKSAGRGHKDDGGGDQCAFHGERLSGWLLGCEPNMPGAA